MSGMFCAYGKYTMEKSELDRNVFMFKYAYMTVSSLLKFVAYLRWRKTKIPITCIFLLTNEHDVVSQINKLFTGLKSVTWTYFILQSKTYLSYLFLYTVNWVHLFQCR